MEITLKLNAKFQPVQGITGDVEQMKNIKIDFLAGAGYTLENIARDDENIPYWVVSELFMELCKKNNLSIRFKEV